MENTTIYLNEKNEGFAIGGSARIVPQKYVDTYKTEMREIPASDFKRIINRTHSGDLINGKPAFARVTEAGSLILE